MTTSDEVRTDRTRYQIIGGSQIKAESRQIEGGDTVLRWTIDDGGLEDLFLKLYSLPVPPTTEDPAMDAIVDLMERECTYAKVIVMTDDDRLLQQRWTSDGQYYRERSARERAAYDAACKESDILMSGRMA